MKQLIISLFILLYAGVIYAHEEFPNFTRDTTHRDTLRGEIKEVQVIEKRQRKTLTGLLSGKLQLNMEGLKSMPKFLGATDPIRTMQLLPGVVTNGEINSGVYIRGGEPGHTHILLNGAPVYNAMHLLGFFSIFNSSHFSHATLLKSHIPAEHGERLSGVLSMQTLDTVSRQFSANGSAGLISSQATFTLPTSTKSTLYLSGRKTYINLIMQALDPSDESFKARYDFQDYNATFILQPSPKHKIVLNGYYGGDNFSIKEALYQANGKIKWHNIAASAQWNYQIQPHKRWEQTLFTASYKNNINMLQNQIDVSFPSDITDIGYRNNYTTRTRGSVWSFGIDYIFHITRPQTPSLKELWGINSNNKPQRYTTHETALYGNCHTELLPSLSADIGLRYSGWFYGKGNFTGGFEPRVALAYELSTNQRLLVSYGLHRQYMSQVTVSGVGFPIDFWTPTTKTIRSQYAHGISAGYFRTIRSNTYEFSGEVYYKRFYRQMEFEGELFDMLNQRYVLEEKIHEGKGYSRGMEVMLKKNQGNLTGWISYTLSTSRRKFPTINNGRSFPAKHDRRHDLSVVGNYAINSRWEYSAVFVYASGTALTMPVALYMLGENAINEYGPHNGARMPAYIRLDLSASYWFVKTLKRESGLNFSLYNACHYKNPIYLRVRVDKDEDSNKMAIRKTGKGIYGLIPSISYMFKF